MNTFYRKLSLFFIVGLAAVVLGCAGRAGNNGNVQSYSFPNVEPDWIRNGESLKYEDTAWYPEDGIESLTDDEVLPIGDYRGVKIFVEKTDVRPYERIYTKFGVNKFRYFKSR